MATDQQEIAKREQEQRERETQRAKGQPPRETEGRRKSKGEDNVAKSVRDRAKAGREILKKQRVQGSPGEKQPEHEDPRKTGEETLEELNKLQEKIAAPTKQSSAKKSQEEGNLNETPPEERGHDYAYGDQNLALANAAAQQVSGARTLLTAQLEADARLTSDPRYERDQKIFELGRTGKLQHVPPSELEGLVQLAQTGLSPELAKAIDEKTPHTPEEQVEQDMKRLEEAEKKAEQIASSKTGEDEKPKEEGSRSVDTPIGESPADDKGTIKPGVKEGYRPPPKPPEEKPPEPERSDIIR